MNDKNNTLTFTLGEKLGLSSYKSTPKLNHKNNLCGCGRGQIELIISYLGPDHWVSKYSVFSGGKTLDGRLEYVPSCKI